MESAVADRVIPNEQAARIAHGQKQAKALKGVTDRIDIETRGWTNIEIQELLYELASDVAERHEAVSKVIARRQM